MKKWARTYGSKTTFSRGFSKTNRVLGKPQLINIIDKIKKMQYIVT